MTRAEEMGIIIGGKVVNLEWHVSATIFGGKDDGMPASWAIISSRNNHITRSAGDAKWDSLAKHFNNEVELAA